MVELKRFEHCPPCCGDISLTIGGNWALLPCLGDLINTITKKSGGSYEG